MTSIAKVLFVVSMLAAVPSFAGDKGPNVVGLFGFDWLHPEKAKCEAVTEKSAASFKSCEYLAKGATGSFSGDADYYKCVAGPKSEYMIYKTKERCAQELDTMQANAP